MTVRLKDGRVLSHRLQDVIPADLDLIRRRFRAAACKAIGADAAKALEAAVDDLDRSTDVGALMQLALCAGRQSRRGVALAPATADRPER